MTPERWQQVKELFNSAIQYRPEERSAFLSQACAGDDDLRSEVDSLITSHEKPGDFIDVPAYQAAAESLVAEKAEFQAGQTIGSYQILSFISHGGMGDVYLAQDRRLSRKVALKLLPTSFTKDVDRLRRFEQEARAASALNHPNIITIYEIHQAGSSQVIATEFVEGETLRQTLSHSALTLTESLGVAIQIADALSAAHKAGIIHRDIKPENVMLRPDGYVKVLDFGLAKLSEQAPANVAAEAPTRQVRTGSGVVMGTAGYMSPEQARGLPVDARSDIFSLGAVIYEMVARHKPFAGETNSDILAAILKTEPPPLSHFVPQAPAELVRIVTKTLSKDREERYQVVQDLLIDLRTLRKEIEFQAKLEQSVVPAGVSRGFAASTSSFAGPAAGPSPHTEKISAATTLSGSLSSEISRHKSGIVVALLAFALTVVAAGFLLYKAITPAPQPKHFQSMKISRLTNSGKVIDTTISPDGKYIVYSLSDAGKQSLWIRQVSTANDKQIVPPAEVGIFGITISRDGNDLYYVVKANLDVGTLYRIPLLGGTSVKILERIDAPVSFSPDGKRLVLVRSHFPNQGESALVIANADGSGERTLAVRKPPERFSPLFFTGPSWSPDGKLIAATVGMIGSEQPVVQTTRGNHVVAFRVDDGKEELLTKTPWPFASRVEWLPDMSGLLVIAGEGVAQSQLWFLSYPDGEKRRITNDLNNYRAIGLTADGQKASLIQANGLVNIWVAPNGDARLAAQLPTGNVGFYAGNGNSLTWTPDGHLAFVSNESGSPDIWLMDPDGSNRKQLTSNAGQNVNPSVSADGRYIVFASSRTGFRLIWRMNIDGSNPKQLTTGGGDSFPVISPDGKWVIYSSISPAKWTLWKVSIDGGNAVELGNRPANYPTISPDGKFVAYFYPDSYDGLAPPNRIGIISIDGGEPVKTFAFQPSGTIAVVAQWSADSRSLLYTVNNNNVTNIWSQPLSGGPPTQVTDFKDSLMTAFAWSPDGKQLACTRGMLMRDAILITDLK